VTTYLRSAGYDVVPIRPDAVEVAGLSTYPTLADVAGPVAWKPSGFRPELGAPRPSVPLGGTA
jgi:hypothetical protein